MKIWTCWSDDLLSLHYRVYSRRDESFKTYLAQITGPNPNYILNRVFLSRDFDRHKRYICFRYRISQDGIYELAVKRFDKEGRYLSRERLWLVVFRGRHYWYADEDMNYQYVLYCEALLRSMQDSPPCGIPPYDGAGSPLMDHERSLYYVE